LKIAVVTSTPAGSFQAHAVNTIKMAEGFARLGHEVLLVTNEPQKEGGHASDILKLYSITSPLEWLFVSKWIRGHFLFACASFQIIKKFNPDYIFTRSYACPWLFLKMGFKVSVESHAHPSNDSFWFRRLVQSSHHQNFLSWITINEALVSAYEQKGVNPDKMLVCADAVDEEMFQRPLRLPESPFNGSNPNITYAGHLYDYKGIPTILLAAKELPDFQFHLVGGTEEDVHRVNCQVTEQNILNVTLHGPLPHKDIPSYLWHSDILLLPPSANHPSAQWTSPVKAGEYLASGTPVIATDIPALKRWFTSKEVQFVSPDNGSILAQAIKELSKDHDRKNELSAGGLCWALQHTYSDRVKKILAFSNLSAVS